LAAPRADTAEVIVAAIKAKTAPRWDHRKIGAGCGRPPDAVVLRPKPVGTLGGHALKVLMAYAEGLAPGNRRVNSF
jgi:hypothetical protein